MTAFGPPDPADAQRFAQLLREHLPRAARLAVRLCGDVHAAEDMLGETMLRAVRARESFHGQSDLGTWLYAILVNTFRDSLRSAPAKRPLLRLADDQEPAAPVRSALGQIVGLETGQRIAAHVSALPPRQREALVLTIYEGLSAQQAADVMQTTAANVRVLVHHARQRLKRELADLRS